jgi:hypothetical protein
MAICGKESPRLTRAVSAYRKEDFKYIHLFDDDSDELYNLRDDESETTNLIDHAEAGVPDLHGRVVSVIVWSGNLLGALKLKAERPS